MSKKEGPRRRGQRVFTYGFDDLVSLTGLSRRTVISDSHPRKVRGKMQPAKFDPADLRSVLRYLLRKGAL